MDLTDKQKAVAHGVRPAAVFKGWQASNMKAIEYGG